uniref:RHS repeat domain-containing protein n=1 Tax=Flavobacterium sp. TaxID=239 RepID=UPI0026201468
TKFFYVYNYTDHLGNVRMSYTDNGVAVPKILEENHYYPFGLKHENYASERFERVKETNGELFVIQPTERREWQYKYNGKEWQDELGLNFYDYGARNYDAAIGRWMNVDLLSENYYPVSPYSYAINNPIYFIDPDGNYIEIYYGRNGTKSERYTYEKNRDYSEIKDPFLADAYKALDALYTASKIEIDGKEVNILQTLMDDKRELSIVEGGEQGGSHFANSRDFESKGKWSENSNKVIGTIHFNTKEGNLYDDVNDTRGVELESLFKNNNLSRDSKVVSATSILGHEASHAFNFVTNPSEYFRRKKDQSTRNQTPYFPNVEEAKATTLSNLININLGEPQRNNYRAIGVPTIGVLSNKIKK